MARILLGYVFVIVLAANGCYGYKHHPKFPKAEEVDVITKVVCNNSFEDIRNEVIEKSRCGAPKEFFEELKLQTSYLVVKPSHVWVKRCIGLCDYDAPGSHCVPTKIRKQAIPVRIYNLKTNKEVCSMYNLDVHESCGCCTSSPKDCSSPRVFNPRKCSCQCPNLEERRSCYKQRNLMKWNRTKCACEKRRNVGW